MAVGGWWMTGRACEERSRMSVPPDRFRRLQQIAVLALAIAVGGACSAPSRGSGGTGGGGTTGSGGAGAGGPGGVGATGGAGPGGAGGGLGGNVATGSAGT